MKILLGLLALVAISSSKSIPNQQQTSVQMNSDLLTDNEDAKLTAPELIEKYGYPVETHFIITEDRYNLTAHRIPYGKRCGPAPGKKVIWLQHGLLGDTSNWIINGPDKGLAYNLADECYDVWMGNFRGNTYSRNHLDLHPVKDRAAFWAFSWHEMGVYDLPADIDYVLNATGVEQIYYVGHSMGTTAFWVGMSERPEYNSKIKLMTALAPIAYTEHMISPLRLISPFVDQIDWLSNMIGLHELLPSNKFMEFMGQTMCHQNSALRAVCSNILFLLAGYNVDQLDPELMPSILGHVPAGSSVRNIVHYGQGINTGKFSKYDFGRKENIEIYGTPVPPEYEVEKVTAPVAFYWGENDWLAVKSDAYRLAARLPNLQRMYRVNHDKYNHLDFLWAKDNLDLINRQTIEFLENF